MFPPIPCSQACSGVISMAACLANIRRKVDRAPGRYLYVAIMKQEMPG